MYVTPHRSVGVEEVIQGLLPGFKGLVFHRPVEGTSEIVIKVHKQICDLIALDMFFLEVQTVTRKTGPDADPVIFSCQDNG